MVGGLAPPPAEEEERREIEAQQQVIFVLESAQLEVAQVGKVGGCIRAYVHYALPSIASSSLCSSSAHMPLDGTSICASSAGHADVMVLSGAA